MGLYLDSDIQFVKGVGPGLGGLFNKAGLYKAKDLVEFIPREYQDRRLGRNIASLAAGDSVRIKAQFIRYQKVAMGPRRSFYSVEIRDSSGVISCKFFRNPYKGFFDQFSAGQAIEVIGKVSAYKNRLEFNHPEMKVLQEGDTNAADPELELIPIYTEPYGISNTKIRKLVDVTIKSLEENYKKVQADDFPEPLPKWILEKFNLPDWWTSLNALHKPDPRRGSQLNQEESPYHKRLIFGEFFDMELKLAFKKQHIKKASSQGFPIVAQQKQKILNEINFTLTTAQTRVLTEIEEDLKQNHPMTRLLQGDVGSGKTLVAQICSLKVIEAGSQVALMAPTEILANQHYQNTLTLFKNTNINVGFLSGGQKTSEQKNIKSKLASGEIQFVVGTHALIQDTVDFDQLGLVIIDEQHRFGVFQRQQLKLKNKNAEPHFLVMTATPIPRTLSMTVYGELDISVIDELPPGRQPIKTKKYFESGRKDTYTFLKQQLQQGRQAYVVCPLVEESENLDLKNVTDHKNWLEEQLPEFRIGLIHGKLKPAEKDELMAKFKNHDFDVLVATTIVEVGVDVPNANIIIIEHSERFGLSQLHQLRGRVGRGQHQSYCFLMLGEQLSKVSIERAKIMEKSTDGFYISEQDLLLRGPGEYLGAKQSGLPGFKFANLLTHTKALYAARETAFEILKEDPNVSLPKNQKLKARLEKFKQDFELAKIG